MIGRVFPTNHLEAAAGERFDERIPRGALVVVGHLHLAHEVGVRVLEAVVALESLGETHDAALAADARHLNRLPHGRHTAQATDLETTSAAASRGDSACACRSASAESASMRARSASDPSSRAAGATSSSSSR